MLFETRVELKDEGLRVWYRVENRRQAPVYLVDHLYRELRSGQRIPDEALFYAIFDSKTGRLELVKRFFPIPEGIEVESPHIPYVTPLPPSEAKMQEAILSLPLQEDYPYRQSRLDAPQMEGVSKTVQVIIGCVSHFDGLKVRELVVSGGRVFKISYLDLERHQQLLESPIINLAIPVIY
ncbi:hypothetical protein KEJ36_03500 [Candidatus Bathyarchaeota archaeon]|nr:hypothetical protein [Candidatus Bathyarchaeota archaeon]